jgi:hypothetical protein
MPSKIDPTVQERALRMIADHRRDYSSWPPRADRANHAAPSDHRRTCVLTSPPITRTAVRPRSYNTPGQGADRVLGPTGAGGTW